MIAVVTELQLLPHPFRHRPIFLGQFFYRLCKIAVQFFLRDAAQGLILSIHADVIGLVETTEHTDLGKLGHSRQQDKLEVVVRRLKDGIKTLQHFSVPV